MFKVLDLEKELQTEQFQEHSYDLVVASFVLHATTNLEQTLHRIRSLLKPGGYLLLLEVTNLDQTRLGFIFGSLPGWWLGADDGRVLSPCVDVETWSDLLVKTGFSGALTTTPDPDPLPFPASVIVAEALDPVTEFLNDPLYSPYDALVTSPAISNLVIIGGLTTTMTRTINHIQSMLEPHCGSIRRFTRLADIAAGDLPSNAVVLNMADLDEPIFRDLSRENFQGLKNVYAAADQIVWITCECWDNNPYHSQSMGFGRSMQVELPHVRSQFIDLDKIGRGTAIEVAECLMRFAVFSTADVPALPTDRLWTTETELVVRGETQMVPRVKPNSEQNDRYNSARRKIEHDTALVDTAVDLHIVEDALEPTIVLSEATVSSNSEVRLRAKLSSVQAFGPHHLLLGSDAKSGETVLSLCDSNASSVTAMQDRSAKCSPDDDKAFFAEALSYLIATTILHGVTQTDAVCILDPTEGVARAIAAYAAAQSISVTFLSTAVGKHCPSSWIKVHPASTAKELFELLPRKVSILVNLGPEQTLLAKLEKLTIEPALRTFSATELFHVGPQMSAQSLLLAILEYAQTSKELSREPPFHENIVDPSQTRHLTHQSGRYLATIDWQDVRSMRVPVQPVFAQNLLRSDKTYWLVGLTGSLGLSLCGWMIGMGARSVVITSRNPKIDPTALAELRSSGAMVTILAWYVHYQFDMGL